MIANRAVVLVGCRVVACRSLVRQIASLVGVRMMAMAARVGVQGIYMRMAQMSMSGILNPDVRMTANMVRPQWHGANAGDYQCDPSSELP